MVANERYILARNVKGTNSAVSLHADNRNPSSAHLEGRLRSSDDDEDVLPHVQRPGGPISGVSSERHALTLKLIGFHFISILLNNHNNYGQDRNDALGEVKKSWLQNIREWTSIANLKAK